LRVKQMDMHKEINATKLNQILYVVKLSSSFFSVLALFQYYFINKTTYLTMDFQNEIAFILIIVSIVLLYFLWSYLWTKKYNYFIVAWVQPIVNVIISVLAIMLTGSYQSNYKFLLLFVIIASTIDSGMKNGLYVAGISSAIILAIDLILAPHTAVNVYFQNDFVLVSTFIIITWTIGFYVKTEKEHIESLKDMLNNDKLTELYNHSFFHESLTKKIEESNKSGKTLSLLFMDIDHFKYYNDFNGHQKGDEILSIIGGMLKTLVRKNDIPARYGGDEFAIILPETDETEALELAEKIRYEIQEKIFFGQEYMPNSNLTMSIGVSVFPEKSKTDLELIKNADEALYRAKFLRKNSVERYTSILDGLIDSLDEDSKDIITSIKTLIAVINAKDKYTYRHVERVVAFARLIADKLKLGEDDKKSLIYSAYIHDIGKINIEQEILVKSTPLTKDEWEKLKEHPQGGVDIIKNVDSLKNVVPIILQHHEKYDGTGYPSGLKGNNITYLARILMVADSFDAMTSNRPYHQKMSFDEGIRELVRCSGTQFDPDIVLEFIKVIKENTLVNI
jgi:diguanylate cyclase (GGDEF)-like protein